MSFCMKNLWRKTQVRPPNSEVRPPNMHAFGGTLGARKFWVREMQVRPPNSKFGRRTLHACGGTFGPRTWPGQPPIKGALSRNGRVFSHFQPQQASDLPLPNLVFFLQSPPFSLSFKVPQKFLSVFKQVWSLEVLELNPSIFRARVVLPLDLQEVSFDLCFFYVLWKFYASWWGRMHV